MKHSQYEKLDDDAAASMDTTDLEAGIELAASGTAPDLDSTVPITVLTQAGKKIPVNVDLTWPVVRGHRRILWLILTSIDTFRIVNRAVSRTWWSKNPGSRRYGITEFPSFFRSSSSLFSWFFRVIINFKLHYFGACPGFTAAYFPWTDHG